MMHAHLTLYLNDRDQETYLKNKSRIDQKLRDAWKKEIRQAQVRQVLYIISSLIKYIYN